MLRKKIVSVLIAVNMMFVLVLPESVSALSDDSITAPSAVLMESSTGKVIYEKNSHEQRPCASVTKVMTLLLVFEAIDSGNLDFEDTITASEHAASMGGSDIWLETGEEMSCDDMIKATVVASANDAAVALAEHISGSEDAFVDKMNARAKELGMNDTVFKNCNGLDEEGHITSAYDVALMSRELIKHEKVYDYTSIWLDNLRGGKTQIVNTNKLLKSYNGITGLKTGTTDDAGCCMTATATRGKVSLIAVVLGCKTGKERFADASALLDYGFANISVKEITLPDDMPQNIKIEKGMNNSVDLQCEISAKVVMDKNENSEIITNVELPETVEAPIKKGQKIGRITYSTADEAFEECDIVAKNDVPRAEFGTVFAVVLESLFAL